MLVPASPALRGASFIFIAFTGSGCGWWLSKGLLAMVCGVAGLAGGGLRG